MLVGKDVRSALPALEPAGADDPEMEAAIRTLQTQISPDVRLSLRAAGAGPALILLHGIGGHAGQWTAQLQALSDRCGVLAWTARGYGASTGPRVRDMGDFIDDLARLLDVLGLDRVLAAGHSMGGRILLELAATRPDRIAAMVLSGAQSAYLAHMSAAEADSYVAKRRAIFEEGGIGAAEARALAASVMSADASPLALDRLTDDFTALNRDGYLAAIEASMGWDREAVLSDLKMPVTVIGGALDAICPPEECHRVAARIGGKPAQILAGVGHMAQIEAPDEVTAILADLVRRHGALASVLDTAGIA